jgi:hypothetical protein
MNVGIVVAGLCILGILLLRGCARASKKDKQLWHL